MGKKSLVKRHLDPESAAAMEIVEMEGQQEQSRAMEQAAREALIARTHQAIGRIQTAGLFGQMATVASLVWIREVKESGIYKELPEIGTWEAFCNQLGKTSRHINEQLQNLETFGEDFLSATSHFKLGYRDLRKLRQLTHEGAVAVGEGAVQIGGESIPLSPDHTEDLQAALEKVIEDKDRELSDARAAVRAKEKVLEAKEQVIQRQEKEIERLENRPKAAVPGEEAKFLEQVEQWRLGFEAWLLQYDPERAAPLPQDATPRMRAALVETLGYFARGLAGAYRAAVEVYGEPDVDDPWNPEEGAEGVYPEDLDNASVAEMLRANRARRQIRKSTSDPV